MISFKKLVCLFVIFGLLAVSIAQGPSAQPQSVDAPMARTDGPSSSESPSSGESSDNVERQFEFNFGSDKIEIKIQLRANGTESELRHEIDATSSGAEFRVEFEQKAGDTENQLRMRLRLFELIEYIPDSTPGYQNETIVNSYRTWNWGNGFVDTTPSSTTSKVYTLKTADNIFGITIRINKPADGSLMFNPEDVKFDIALDADAMRAAGWLNGTEVALKTALVSRLESEKQHDDDSKQTENSINVGSSGASQFGALFVSWINYIQCDVNKVSVVSSAMRVDQSQVEADDDSDSTAHVVAFAFINLNDHSNTACIWDPVVSATRAVSTSTSDAASVVASLAVIATAIVAMF